MRIYYILLLFLMFSFGYGQDIVWTGGAGNQNFFDEENWKFSDTGLAPPSGTLDPESSIDLHLFIDNVSDEVIVDGPLHLGSGTLEISHAAVSGTVVSGGNLIIRDRGYMELVAPNPLSENLKVTFSGSSGWLKLPAVSPKAVSNELQNQFLVDGNPANYPANLRIDNYYSEGSLVRKEDPEAVPLTIYDQEAHQGDSADVQVDMIHAGNMIPGGMNDKIASFNLSRGYMVTMAENSDGTGLSKVFIASEADLYIHDLPPQLKGIVSFIRVVPWNWVSKKGIGGLVTGLNETWYYTWSNNGNSSIDREYAPMSWGKGGADDPSDIELYKNKYKATHVMGFNEPDDCHGQSGQYGNLCDTDVAVATYENLMKTGLRLVSPGCREGAPFGWLREFYEKAVAQNIRIDVIALHWYDWVSNPANSPNADPQQVFNRFKSYLQRVHDLYQLPVWITEFNANPNRTTAVNKAFMELALPYLETLDFVERYAWFQPNSDVADYYDGQGGYTEVGLFYRNHLSSPAIPEVVYSAPSNLDGKTNPHSVFEDYFEHYTDNQNLGEVYTVWEGVASAVDRSLTADWGEPYDGDKFGRADAQNENFYLRKKFDLEAGKTYTWQLATRMQDGLKHVMKVLPDSIYPTLECYNSEWESHSVEFTVLEGATSITLSLYRWPKKYLFFDNYILREKVEEELTDLAVPSIFSPDHDLRVYPNPAGEYIYVSGIELNKRMEIFDIQGRAVYQGTTDFPLKVSFLDAGVYILRIDQRTVRFLKN